MTVVKGVVTLGSNLFEGASAPDNDRSLEPVITDLTETARGLEDFDGHELIIRASDRRTGLRAIVAIHDRTLGPALGGCRFWPYKSESDAITDALRLSRGMTYKAALAELPVGGGKSVIVGNPKSDKSEALFRSFGRVLESLEGKYVSGEDVGTSVEDIDWVAQETRYVVGGHRGHGGDPSPMTARGVHVGIKAALKYRRQADTAAGLVVAVQGLGHVGSNLCRLLHEDGARLVVSDIDKDAVDRARKEFGAKAVEPSGFPSVEADVLAPCALGGTLNDQTIPMLRCSVIAGSANNQLLEERHGEALRDRGILYAPDYVINAGGLIGVSLELTEGGYNRERVLAMTDRIGETLIEIFERSDADGAATNFVANRIAVDRIDAARKQAKGAR